MYLARKVDDDPNLSAVHLTTTNNAMSERKREGRSKRNDFSAARNRGPGKVLLNLVVLLGTLVNFC